MTFARCGTISLNITGLLGGPALHFADPFFHLFAWFERDHELLWYKDFIAGPGISGFACSPAFHLKYTEIPQLDAMILDERFYDGIERLLNDFLRLELGEPDLFGDGFDNLFFGHVQGPL
jgi:hypothetical protein